MGAAGLPLVGNEIGHRHFRVFRKVFHQKLLPAVKFLSAVLRQFNALLGEPPHFPYGGIEAGEGCKGAEGMNFKPHDYQSYAIDYIETHPASAVLLDMGLGKTVISLTAISDLLFDSFEAHRVLVVAPLRVTRDNQAKCFIIDCHRIGKL